MTKERKNILDVRIDDLVNCHINLKTFQKNLCKDINKEDIEYINSKTVICERCRLFTYRDETTIIDGKFYCDFSCSKKNEFL